MSTADNHGKLYKAEMAAKLAGEGFLEAAHFLRQILEVSPEEFDETCSLLGIGRRKGYYLAEIDRRFHELEVDYNRLHSIGWTKLRIIARHIEAENADALLNLAASHAAHELAKLMKNEPLHAKTHAVLLYLSPTQYSVFRQALLKYGALPSGTGLFNKEQSLTDALTSVLS